MNDEQKRHLVATFRHIDELLAEAEAKLVPPEAARLFPPYAADAAPVQRKVTADYSRRARAAMAAALNRFGASSPPPELSGVWAARTTLMKAQRATRPVNRPARDLPHSGDPVAAAGSGYRLRVYAANRVGGGRPNGRDRRLSGHGGAAPGAPTQDGRGLAKVIGSLGRTG